MRSMSRRRHSLYVSGVVVLADLFPLEFWLHLGGNAKGAPGRLEHRKTDVSIYKILRIDKCFRNGSAPKPRLAETTFLCYTSHTVIV
jgi:hypothetical protein